MEEAFKKSIEGGYNIPELLDRLGIRNIYKVEVGKKYMTVKTLQGNIKQLCSFEKILLDPSFWKCLGKSLGWKEKYKHRMDEKINCLRCLDCNKKPMIGDGKCYRNITDEWKDKMLAFTSHIADGGDANKFISNLIKK